MYSLACTICSLVGITFMCVRIYNIIIPTYRYHEELLRFYLTTTFKIQ